MGHQNKCLVASQENKGPVDIGSCNMGDQNQQWTVTVGTGQIKAKTGRCLEAANRNFKGGPAIMRNCNVGSKKQHWTMQAIDSSSQGRMPVLSTSHSGKYFNYALASNLFIDVGSGVGDTLLVRQWRQNINIWSGLIRHWTASGRRDPLDTAGAGQWKAGDEVSIVKNAIEAEALSCTAWPTTTGTYQERCEHGNTLGDGYWYVYNYNRQSDPFDAVCGIGA